jgi:hypothetical protein
MVYRKCDTGRALTTHSFPDTVPGARALLTTALIGVAPPELWAICYSDIVIWYQGSHFVL